MSPVSGMMPAFGSAAGTVGVFMMMETYKDVILPKIWKLGVLMLILSLAAAMVVYSSGTATHTMSVRVTVMATGILHTVSAFFAFWTCTNKKGDLVLKRHIQKFHQNMLRLKAAEDRLKGALEAMHLADKDMAGLREEIQKAQKQANEDLTDIEDLSKRSMEGGKRQILAQIVELADMKGDKKYDLTERERLFLIISNMGGLREGSTRAERLKRGLRIGEHQYDIPGGVEDSASFGGNLCMTEQDVVNLLDRESVFSTVMGGARLRISTAGCYNGSHDDGDGGVACLAPSASSLSALGKASRKSPVASVAGRAAAAAASVAQHVGGHVGAHGGGAGASHPSSELAPARLSVDITEEEARRDGKILVAGAI
jgi:uncharacterized lipoprotein YehR (DUF1307 family)